MTAAAPTFQERRTFGDLADDVAYLRRVCWLTVAPYREGFRVGEGASVEVLTAEQLQRRAERERDRRARSGR
jgi:hypothetical protein